MKIEFEIGGDQIDGARDYQEDAYMVSQLGDNADDKSTALVIMADGMGGHAAGNVASNMVVAAFNKNFQSKFPPSKPSALLEESLLIANEQIATSVKETPALSGMGCTMVTVYLEGENLWWVSVGDSHLYLIREKELIKQNADHSYGAFLDMMIEQGEQIDEDSGMSRNMLMSAMTGNEISSIDCPDSPLKVKPGDRIIVASDGLDTLGAGAIIQYSTWSNTAKECVYALLKAVEDVKRKKQDNTTIIVIDVKEKASSQQAKPELATQQEKQATSKQRVTDFEIEEEKSSLPFISILLIIIFAGGGYFAWSKGLLDGVISTLHDLASNQLEVQPTSTPLISKTINSKITQSSPVNSVKKAPVYSAPRKPPTYIEKPKFEAKPFNDKLKNGLNAPTMMPLPAGRFRMGGPSSAVASDEVPRHNVSVKAFAMSVYEVSYADYELFAKANNKPIPNNKGWDKKKHPVNFVSWDDAIEYSQWLSQQTGHKYRLASEAEWEYAARAGTNTSFWWGAKKGSNHAHCFDCDTDLNPNKPAKIGSFKPNPFGLYDMNGNISEWVHDCYHKNYNNAPTDGSVWEGGDCTVRVVRGGAYSSPASSMRSANREKFTSNKGHYNVGIRLVREL